MTKRMTVRELRETIANAPDDAQVIIGAEFWSEHGFDRVVNVFTSAEVVENGRGTFVRIAGRA